MGESKLHELSKRGQSVWIDYLSRDMLEEGELARMMSEDAVVGVTSNPTIFQKAISHGDRYDEQLRQLLEEETDPKEIFLQLSARDVEAALDLLYGPVYHRLLHGHAPLTPEFADYVVRTVIAGLRNGAQEAGAGQAARSVRGK